MSMLWYFMYVSTLNRSNHSDICVHSSAEGWIAATLLTAGLLGLVCLIVRYINKGE